MYLAVSNILRHLETPAFPLFGQDLFVQQSLVSTVMSLNLVSPLQPSGFASQLERLQKSQFLPAWSDAAVRIATALQQHQGQRRFQQVERLLSALYIAGPVLAFWLRIVCTDKDRGAVQSYASTIVPAAKLAADILRAWPAINSRSSKPRPTARDKKAEGIALNAITTALEVGNTIAITLNIVTATVLAADLPPDLLADDAVLHVLMAQLASNTMILHKQCKGLAAVQISTTAGTSSSRGSPGKAAAAAAAVPPDHDALLAAIDLEGWSHVNPDRAANSSSIGRSCHAVSRLLLHRFKSKHRQGLEAAVQDCTKLDALRTPLLHVCIEQLLLLGPTKDLRCTAAALTLIQDILWMDGKHTSAAAARPSASQVASASKLVRERQQLLLLELGPLMLAAAKEGTAAGVPSEFVEQLRADVLLMFTRIMIAAASTGGTNPFAAAFEIAPLTASTVLEAVVRSQGTMHTTDPAAAAMAATAYQQLQQSGSASVGWSDVMNKGMPPPMLLSLIQVVLASMQPPAAVTAAVKAAAGTDDMSNSTHPQSAQRSLKSKVYPPSAAAAVQATAAKGLLLVQLPNGPPGPHAQCCLLLSCLKYATTLCNATQYWQAGINIVIQAQMVLLSDMLAFSCLGANSRGVSSSNSSIGERRRYAALLAVTAARCDQLLADLLGPSTSVELQVNQQQQQLDQEAAQTRLPLALVLPTLEHQSRWLYSALVVGDSPNYQHLHIPDDITSTLACQLAQLEDSLAPAATAATLSQTQEQLASEAMVRHVFLDKAHKPLRQIATILQQQLPVWFCCNYTKCIELQGYGEFESVSRPGTRCSLCKTARYCTPACQKAAWKEHKPVCARLKQTA